MALEHESDAERRLHLVRLIETSSLTSPEGLWSLNTKAFGVQILV